jgi:two-component system, LytTR family, response regulator
VSQQEHASKIRTLIVDDEPLARTSLRILLRNDPEIEIAGECGSGADALKMVRAAKPDLVFLDVQMPDHDGFDVIEMLGSDLPAATVFVTAYDQYALRAFDAGALDYLLKPFDNARFERALRRAKERLLTKPARPQSMDRLVIKSAGQILFVPVTEIDWIEAADYYACLHVGCKTHLLRRSMADLEHDLPPELFCRVHRSAIVNLARVRSIDLGKDGEYEVCLDSGARLRLSRSHRAELKERLGLRGAQVGSGGGDCT